MTVTCPPLLNFTMRKFHVSFFWGQKLQHRAEVSATNDLAALVLGLQELGVSNFISRDNWDRIEIVRVGNAFPESQG